jgi:TRAP-type C4-dicarboxylate transport system permease small subunit
VRRCLDVFYAVTALAAALCLVTIALLILAQVGLRFVGIQLPSADDIAGYALVGATMLGLAPTYRQNGHIRVGLLIEAFTLGSTARRWLERIVTAFAVLLVAWAAWASIKFVHESYIYNEVSQGLLPIKLWIPQSLMALGIVAFLIALVDDLITDLSGGLQSHLSQPPSEDTMPVEK